MSRAVRLVVFELRSQWRGLVPSPAVRIAIATFCAAWTTVFSYAAYVAVRGTDRSRAELIVPLIALFAGTALSVAMAAIARTLREPERLAIWRLAPVAPAWAMTMPLAASAILTSVATLTFAFPAIVAAAANHVLQAVFVTAVAVITALWTLALAVAILAGVAARRGTAAASRLGSSLLGPVAVLMIVGLRAAEGSARQIDHVTLGIAWLASAALLPAALRTAALKWAAALSMGPPTRRSRPPRWGSPSWGHLLGRTPFAWSMLGVLPLVISASTTTLRVALMFGLMLPSIVMFHLVRWEDERPDRQKLAPAGARMRFNLWLHTGMPANLLVSAAAMAVLQDVMQLAVFAAGAWSSSLLFLWQRQRPRAALQLAVIVVSTMFLFTARVDAQSRTAGAISENKTTAIISGRVHAADTGAPLPRARVRVVSTADRQPITLTADERGSFELRDLKPGRYVLAAAKGGYVQGQFGQRRAFVPGTPIDVRAGDEIKDLNIHLAPGASIDGRIVDEFGEPVVDAVVMTMRSQFAGGRKRLSTAGRVLTTNDRGEFHLFGLPAGTYYLAAAIMTGQSTGEGNGRDGYAPTYFPGTVDLGSAQPITIEEGEQRAGVDVMLSLVKTASISGVARDVDGRPFASGNVSVVHVVGGFPLPVASGAIAGDGTFQVRNVPPGNFSIVATTTPAPDGGRESASQHVSVTGDDLAGIVLSVPQPATIAGVVLAEVDEAEPLRSSVRVRVAPADPVEDLGDSGTLVRTEVDGTFASRIRAGRARIELVDAPAGWFLSRVIHNDREVTDAGIQSDPSDAVQNVRVLLTRRATTVSGTVTDRSRQPARDCTVVIFARDRSLWTFRSRYVAAVRPHQDGAFSIKGLPAGDYLIAAIDHVEQGEPQDPDFLDTIRGQAEPISLAPGASRSVSLSITRRQ